ncbi:MULTISPECIES: TetR/AcrR family transcriptional regulator [unclassified Actinotalea]|uniref:TetR/AcrR family transcriptional regulator n=1 Tax=unclassified Actinotalea TaxID=2638618 RepID=UPI0015F6E95E|nr:MULTISPECIES: TetR/AcrR family transcriptional regulator [unclassified Actinotalea]
MTQDPKDPQDSIGAATRALADATASLTRLLGEHARSVMPEVGEAVASSLREAARGLAEASEAASRATTSGGSSAEERRRQKVDRTRADLLEAAARVIAAKGYEGASVGDIAAEAGYTKGAVYAHFGSKEEVFLALASDMLRVTIDSPGATIPGVTVDGVDQDAVAEWLTSVMDDHRILLSLEFLAYGLRHPEASGELARLHVTSHEVLADQIAEVRRARRGDDAEPGTTQDDFDTALAVISVINVATLEGRLTGSPRLSPRAGARVIAKLLG